ncbi:MAG: hypothetical protein RLZZ171_642 [Cyanobacteriota bacterium]|jgi:hypothetical protein
MNEHQLTPEEQIANLLCQLNRKFALLHNSLTDRVKSLTPLQLNSLTDDLPRLQTRADLQVWLANLD